jgi:predicted N-acetyltransferase YhbS
LKKAVFGVCSLSPKMRCTPLIPIVPTDGKQIGKRGVIMNCFAESGVCPKSAVKQESPVEYAVLTEEEISPKLDQELVDYLSRIFPEWAEVFAKQRAWHDARPIWTVLAFSDEKVVGHVAVVERTITTDWNWRYKVVSLQGVSVSPDWRNHGIGRKLLKMALDEPRRRGYPFATIFCKEELVPYYESLGWQLPDDSMIMWKDRALPIAMRSNCPMYQTLGEIPFPEGPIDVHNPFGFDVLDRVGNPAAGPMK